jgi:hypothetical protein
MNKKLLPITLLSPLALVSCTISFISSKSESQSTSSSEASRFKEMAQSIIAAKATSFMQSDVALGSNDPVLKSQGNQKLLVIPVSVRDYAVQCDGGE